jgi:predicted aconitase with swiveling domain
VGQADLQGVDVVSLQAEVLLAGPAARATALALTAPISFWGGVDPKSGVIADPRHPEHGQQVAGRILLVPETVGSSSAAAILLELVHANHAPAAIVLHQPDAILLLGLIVAKEMGYETPIALRLDRQEYSRLGGRQLEVSRTGLIHLPPI